MADAMRSVDELEPNASDGRIVALELPLSLKHSVYYDQDMEPYKPHIDGPRTICRHAQFTFQRSSEMTKPYTQSYGTSQKWPDPGFGTI
ncbi:hypothetical protein BU15DRAFT_76219 [Melanogaster broomeanus]|nr:hypothetical protein BU15DRAFT_76219 [Melanogaster broomeanus]